MRWGQSASHPAKCHGELVRTDTGPATADPPLCGVTTIPRDRATLTGSSTKKRDSETDTDGRQATRTRNRMCRRDRFTSDTEYRAGFPTCVIRASGAVTSRAQGRGARARSTRTTATSTVLMIQNPGHVPTTAIGIVPTAKRRAVIPETEGLRRSHTPDGLVEVDMDMVSGARPRWSAPIGSRSRE